MPATHLSQMPLLTPLKRASQFVTICNVFVQGTTLAKQSVRVIVTGGNDGPCAGAGLVCLSGYRTPPLTTTPYLRIESARSQVLRRKRECVRV